MKYPTAQVNAVDQENADIHEIIPGAWREITPRNWPTKR
jgi:hypothetical protein